jgi:hypothetical protein
VAATATFSFCTISSTETTPTAPASPGCFATLTWSSITIPLTPSRA